MHESLERSDVMNGIGHALLSCVFVDVGDTLLPGSWASAPAVVRAPLDDLQATLPDLPPATVVELNRTIVACQAVNSRAAAKANSFAQDVDGVVGRALRQLGLPDDASRVAAVRRALNPPPDGHLAPFTGAVELLSRNKALGLRCVAVSNATFRDRHAYRRDFDAVGIGPYVDDVVSSVDVGFRKPHRAIFDAALAPAGCPPDHYAMIGNSKLKDIQPALALGMRTILVCVTAPRPARSDAHAVVGALHEAADVVARWTPPSVG